MPIYEPKWGPVLTQEERSKFELVMMIATRGSATVNGAVWNTIMARTAVRKEGGGMKGPVITVAALPLTGTRGCGAASLAIGINPDKFFALPVMTQVQMVLLTLSKILNGRVGSEGVKLEEKFGTQSTELGMLMYLTQAGVIEVDQIEEAGYHIPTIKDLGLPADQLWSYYTAQVFIHYNEQLDEMMKNCGTFSEIGEEEDAVNDAMKSLYSDVSRRSDMTGKNRGLFAGDFSEMMQALFTPPKVAWQDILQFKENGRGRQFTIPTKRRFSRRGPPSMYHGHRYSGSCNVVVICDTSGSRTVSQIATVTAELRAMHQRGARVVFVQADAIVQDVMEYTGSESDLEIHGRGGTEIQPAIDQMDIILDKAGMDQVDILVIATDGFTDSLDCKEYETLILLDDDAKSPEDYMRQVSGQHVDIFVLEKPDKYEDPNSDVAKQ